MAQQTQEIVNTDSVESRLRSELEQYKRTLKETSMMVDQSQSELAKLTQRNTIVAGHLQQVQMHFESLPKEEIRSAYTDAMDSQFRLLMMKGQLEKLRSDRANLEVITSTLENCLNTLGDMTSLTAKGVVSQAETLENMVKAQESVRLRLSRQMHDGPAQALANFIVQTEIAARLFEIDPNRAREELNNINATALSTFQKVRAYIFELRPMMLDDLGLFATMQRYKDAFKEQTGIDVEFTKKGKDVRFEPYIDVMIFRAVQEIMGNSYRYNIDSIGKISINVTFITDDETIRVSVSDNGKGFNPDTVLTGDGLGLRIIRERVEMLGGTMDIESAVGQGCQVSFQIPYKELKAATPPALKP